MQVYFKSTLLFKYVPELFTLPHIRVYSSFPVEEGNQVKLECVTVPKESPSQVYMFFKDSKIIRSADKNNSHVIGRAGEEHTGSYQCSVQSQDGKVSKNSTNVHIRVQVPISGVSITADEGDVNFVHGESLTLKCSVEKGSSPSFLWLHNETVVDKDSELYQLRDNGTVLYIESLLSLHAGTYGCKVSNKLQANKPSMKVFQISQISENPEPGESTYMKAVKAQQIQALGLVKKRYRMACTRSLSVNPLACCHLDVFKQKQIIFINLFIEPPPKSTKSRDVGRSANEGTSRAGDIDNNQHLYSNDSIAQEEDDICYTYIDITKIQASAGPTNKADELSVVYSVLKPQRTSTETRATPETDDSANVYQNLHAKRH
ncbi:igLON family member 5-like [Mantella aurantiaca]